MKPSGNYARLLPDARIFGVNNMKRELSDEQLDKLMRKFVKDASADDSTIDEVVDSPALWWAVQRRINAEASSTSSPWPPNIIWRWLMIGAPAAAALALLISFIVFRPAGSGVERVQNAVTPTAAATIANKRVQPSSIPVIDPIDSQERIASKISRTTIKDHNAIAKQKPKKIKEPTTDEKASVIKTDFIALSYARDPESGQIVRVKVPRSMMVTLGLVASVEKPANLVDAEIILGDDGLTRAIRFIR